MSGEEAVGVAGLATQGPDSADGSASGTARRVRKQNPLASRIKRLMQADEDVGKIAQATPLLIARALELFLGRLCSGAAAVAAEHHAKTLTPAHLKAAVGADGVLDFLKDAVADAPELPPPEEAKPKRKRASKASAAASSDPEAPAPKKRAPRKRKPQAAASDGSDSEAGGGAEPWESDNNSDGTGTTAARRKKAAAARKRVAAAARKAGKGTDGSGSASAVQPAEPAAQAVDAAAAAQPAVGDDLGGGWTVAELPRAQMAAPTAQESQQSPVQSPEQQRAASDPAADVALPAPTGQLPAVVLSSALHGSAAPDGLVPEEDDYD